MSENLQPAFDKEGENYRMIVEHLTPPCVEVAEGLKAIGATPMNVGMVLHDVLHTQILPHILTTVYNDVPEGN